jgi:hypothetical protein
MSLPDSSQTTSEPVGRHRFEDGHPVCVRCGGSRSGALLGLESPFPSECRTYARTFRYWLASRRRDAIGLRMALQRAHALDGDAMTRPSVPRQTTVAVEGGEGHPSAFASLGGYTGPCAVTSPKWAYTYEQDGRWFATCRRCRMLRELGDREAAVEFMRRLRRFEESCRG